MIDFLDIFPKHRKLKENLKKETTWRENQTLDLFKTRGELRRLKMELEFLKIKLSEVENVKNKNINK